MHANELHQLLTASGWECEMRGSEVRMRTCYFCGNEKQNLELSADKGVYHCWACKRGGRLDALLQSLTGQKHHIPLAKRDTAARPIVAVPQEFKSAPVQDVISASTYLGRRGMSPTLAAAYGVRVCIEPTHRLYGRLVVPMREFWTNALVGWLGRTYSGQQPKYLSTLPHKIITGWKARDPSVPVVVVEGPFDGITAHRAGFAVAVLGGTGDAGLEAWAARLPPQSQIVVALDGDAVQQAHRLLWQLRAVRGTDAGTTVASLAPGEDPDSLGPSGVQEVVQAALRGGAPTITGQ